MRMLNRKRLGLFLSLLLLLPLLLVVSSVYFFNVNDYAGWITQQIEKSTGYEVRFEHIENSWWEDKRFVFTGIAVYQQQQRLLSIDKLALQLNRFSWSQRQIDINSLQLEHVAVEHQQHSLTAETIRLNDLVIGIGNSGDASLTYLQKLSFSQMQLIAVDASLQTHQGSIELQHANLKLNEQLVINDWRIQTWPSSLVTSFDVEQVQITDNQLKAMIKNLKVALDADLIARQGQLSLSSGELLLSDHHGASLQGRSFASELQLLGNKLSIEHLALELFSGQLALQADIYLAVELFPKLAITLSEVEVISLTAQDMQFDLAELTTLNSDSSKLASASPEKGLPIGKLSFLKVKLKNIDISSKNNRFPLTLTGADVHIQDWVVIKEGLLLDPSQPPFEQSGTFLLAFDFLRWKEAQIEQFSMASNLDGQQTLSLLQQMTRNN